MGLPWDFRPLTGERVRIDLLQRDDFDALFAFQSDPEVCRYLPYEPRTREGVAEALARDSAADRLSEQGDFIQPAIRDAGGRLLGTMFLKLASVQDRTAEIGWVLDPRFHGQGYAREAAALTLDLAFGELGLHRVCARLDVRNDASATLCRRLGMRLEAHFVEDLWFKQEWADTGVYGILDREWAARG